MNLDFGCNEKSHLKKQCAVTDRKEIPEVFHGVVEITLRQRFLTRQLADQLEVVRPPVVDVGQSVNEFLKESKVLNCDLFYD